MEKMGTAEGKPRTHCLLLFGDTAVEVIEDLVERAVELGMTGLALHGGQIGGLEQKA